ncbi:MAG: triose-phosphate isomerase [Gemmatimonadetes bacterium]|nr:triose-phosphate isomerase [Gemmatimonadota bacterium]
MCRPMIAANWKMHLGRVDEALAFVRGIRHPLSRVEHVELVLCPPFTVLSALAEVLRPSPIALGAQNMHWEERGAHTGEISPTMLAGLCRYVILGHSERRATGGASEGDAAVGRKAHAALAHGLVPIVCVGESAERKKAGATHDFVGGQVRAALAGLAPEQVSGCVIAYEPVWAIGSGRSATPAEANRTAGLTVRGTIAETFGEDAARAVRVLYGGSVGPDNIAAFMAMPEINGALVGGASLGPEFVELVRRAAAVAPPRPPRPR